MRLRLSPVIGMLVAISGCGGADGAAGSSVHAGTTGSGASGADGAGVRAGTNGANPAAGTAGVGPDGAGVLAGTNGANPSAGTAGVGPDGTGVLAGTNGANPSAGTAGDGAAGTGGEGAAGTNGAAGAGVQAGTSGANPSAGPGGVGAAGRGATTSDGCPLDLVGFAGVEGGTTGGGEAAATRVSSQAELKACATAAEARVCLVAGTITFSPFEEIDVKSNKTILGEGADAEIVMGGFRLNAGVRNVIIRNLTIRDSYVEGQYEEGGDEGGDRDGIQMDTAEHVWIDHVHFRHLGDGMIDSRKDTTFLTVSWNILDDHNKAFGIGWTDNVTAQMTIHHNWLRDTVQRNPSTDNVLRAHLFNNLLEDVESYGNYSRGMTNMVLQNSVFVRVKDPHYYDTGTLVATGNVYRDTTGRKAATGDAFSFFDPSEFYAYTLDSAADAEAIVRRCAGPRAELGRMATTTR